MLKLAQQTDLSLLTGGRSNVVVRFCGFPPQGSETHAAPIEDRKNSTRKPQAISSEFISSARIALSADLTVYHFSVFKTLPLSFYIFKPYQNSKSCEVGCVGNI